MSYDGKKMVMVVGWWWDSVRRVGYFPYGGFPKGITV